MWHIWKQTLIPYASRLFPIILPIIYCCIYFAWAEIGSKQPETRNRRENTLIRYFKIHEIVFQQHVVFNTHADLTGCRSRGRLFIVRMTNDNIARVCSVQSVIAWIQSITPNTDVEDVKMDFLPTLSSTQKRTNHGIERRLQDQDMTRGQTSHFVMTMTYSR